MGCRVKGQVHFSVQIHSTLGNGLQEVKLHEVFLLPEVLGYGLVDLEAGSGSIHGVAVLFFIMNVGLRSGCPTASRHIIGIITLMH